MASPVHACVGIGNSIVRAFIDNDGAIRTSHGSLLEVDDVDALVWMTRRAVTAVLDLASVNVGKLETIALAGPSGRMTAAGTAVEAAVNVGGRNGQTYSTEEIIAKGGYGLSEKAAAALYAKVQSFYAVEVEAAA